MVLGDRWAQCIPSIRDIRGIRVDRNILVVPLVPLVRQSVELVVEVREEVDNKDNNVWYL